MDQKDTEIIAAGQRVLDIESRSILQVRDRLGEDFAHVVRKIDASESPLIVTGLGKSGIIGSKIAATFSSIGIPALFLHAAEASHGDLGIIAKHSLVLAISNSGETEELIKILPAMGRLNCTLVAMTGNANSTLAQRSDFLLNTSVDEEACGKDLVPTSSTTATLALGDALAMALLALRGFKEEDFAVNHPGGSLGKKLLMTVNDLMHAGSAAPIVSEQADIFAVLKEMSAKRFGTTFVVSENGDLSGVITDGDLRRLIEKKQDISRVLAREMMGSRPKTIQRDNLATKAAFLMEQHSITALAVTEDGKKIEGILHLHDLLKAGII
ncbi:MAG: KpsF/GutQ family sugar-phosphate isomerase [Candidatus Nitrohelix vancouverensis]|uniref:KpsF/GutQ family sugar-phosphate isomerase n=1 Tax=Candidatus Nitrohelix vancouverensis TaxID=2705534 RepID=A0A7T0C3F8_9BACT|nr:MAG: KpsF/GutQ family sugar-phosphate isomerase [Candidatus Nitrohelix vancouverensis]